ncbi:gas vesicle protein [Nocardiopsis sp. RSe5-2]|uniref:Gas vesicle protein n=1 Tax=Nocardiopsis endophytica TaxID=3018445 RepID=A0ABT4UD45_9ACTN|nr:gas vesicle protein [Nocardiopsis endophytica]MDA2814915.1 gas vesicle protein [Nocardiopsis endophytica]
MRVHGGERPALPEWADSPFGDREVALVDLLDRVLATGVVVIGDLTISIAGVDLVRVSLNALVASIDEDTPSPWEGGDKADAGQERGAGDSGAR